MSVYIDLLFDIIIQQPQRIVVALFQIISLLHHLDSSS